MSPLDLTPAGNRLLDLNTADNRLEVLDVSTARIQSLGSIPVGLDPVSVGARTDTEAWVVNHVSDSISIVNLDAMTVVRSLFLGDESADVVFAGAPRRAFVSVSQQNRLAVYDNNGPGAPPLSVPIEGKDPRAFATDGSRVYVAIFESPPGSIRDCLELAFAGF